MGREPPLTRRIGSAQQNFVFIYTDLYQFIDQGFTARLIKPVERGFLHPLLFYKQIGGAGLFAIGAQKAIRVNAGAA